MALGWNDDPLIVSDARFCDSGKSLVLPLSCNIGLIVSIIAYYSFVVVTFLMNCVTCAKPGKSPDVDPIIHVQNLLFALLSPELFFLLINLRNNFSLLQ